MGAVEKIFGERIFSLELILKMEDMGIGALRSEYNWLLVFYRSLQVD